MDKALTAMGQALQVRSLVAAQDLDKLSRPAVQREILRRFGSAVVQRRFGNTYRAGPGVISKVQGAGRSKADDGL